MSEKKGRRSHPASGLTTARSLDPTFAVDFREWSKHPAGTSFPEFQKKRREQRWKAIHASMIASGPPSSFRKLGDYKFGPPKNFRSTPQLLRTRQAQPPDLRKSRMPQTSSVKSVEELEIQRLRRELTTARAKNRQAMMKSESSFRKWLVGIIGNVATTFALGALRGLWTITTGTPPIF